MFEMQSTTINIRVKTKSPYGFSFFVFQNDILRSFYIYGNTLRRGEVAVPILDEKLRARLDSQKLFYEQAYAAEKRL